MSKNRGNKETKKPKKVKPAVAAPTTGSGMPTLPSGSDRQPPKK